ncbi:ribonucleoside-diphosphate reductase small chain [Emiliania huxleyi virus 164]|nr:ribonucleoside-diphosphate reductase small chain [Emiliania huxleyi virus 164]
MSEPLLIENKDRFVLFPIVHEDIYEEYKKAEASLWGVSEIDISTDKTDWPKLTENEQHFIKYILAFFATADGIVFENLVTNFASEIQYPEARCFYGVQMMIENVHAETYSMMLQSLVEDKDEQRNLFRAIRTIQSIKNKADWALKWMNNERSFAERLIAFAVVEGIFFSGAFCAIFWLKKRAIMPGLTFSNELISRDEGLHTDFACMLYRNHIIHKLPYETVLDIITNAVELERLFICEALPVSLIGINAESMSTYIKFVADRLLISLGYAKHYNVVNPFEWMELISLEGKTNFFEKELVNTKKQVLWMH